MMNRQKRFLFLRTGILAAGVLYTLFCRFYEPAAEWYARHLYPGISAVLSTVSSVFPFSLEEILVVCALAALIIFPFIALRKGMRRRTVVAREIEAILWIYVWFYLGWGLNYYRHSFFTRTGSVPQEFDRTAFERFVYRYTDSLQTYYPPQRHLSKDSIAAEIKRQYGALPVRYGLQSPRACQKPKCLLFNSLYSNVGVLGFMGPFFCEMQLNHELLPDQYAFTYAHELSHLLGVSNEAEANFWAYYTCTRSSLREIKGSGYFNLLPYVIVNVRLLTDEHFYRNWLDSLRPDILEQLRTQQTFWASRYNPYLGKAQDLLYEFYLKGNRISSGQKNYSEVVALVMAFDKNHNP